MTDPEDPTLPLDEPFPEEPAYSADEIGAPEAPLPAADVPASEMPTAEMPTLEMLAAKNEAPTPPQASAPAVAVTGRVPASAPTRPDLLDRQEPLYRSHGGYRLRLEPADLARLRELPGSRGKSDDELGETFFDGQAERIAASVAGDVPTGAELRVVVDPYSRQAFVALEKEIRGILSF